MGGEWLHVREELSSLSRLICDIVNSVGQGPNVIFVRKKLNFRNHCLWHCNQGLYVPYSLN